MKLFVLADTCMTAANDEQSQQWPASCQSLWMLIVVVIWDLHVLHLLLQSACYRGVFDDTSMVLDAQYSDTCRHA